MVSKTSDRWGGGCGLTQHVMCDRKAAHQINEEVIGRTCKNVNGCRGEAGERGVELNLSIDFYRSEVKF